MIIDRIEGDYAVCELSTNTFTEVPVGLLPPGVKEGDVLRLEDGQYRIDVDATIQRRMRVRNKMDILFRRRPARTNPPENDPTK